MKFLGLILISLMAVNASAAEDLGGKMDALGANKDLMRKARAIDPENRIRVVQNRDVDRYWRLELGVNYGMATGGDPYFATNVMGGQIDLHITPRWSLGARYYNNQNSQTAEGKQVFAWAEQAATDQNSKVRLPGTDLAKDTWLVIGNWYPIYGKINLFDASISQFDMYLLGGAGQVNLESGSAPVYTAGGGVGFWFTQHFATRLEARWQGYSDRPSNGTAQAESREINQTLLTATVSFLL